ncbi:MAG: hypothetical protein U0L11_05745 [Acutalibacteraceae bacterium]|nr:hypothetical protein [Acutalibacteraceae bacterium]
MENNYYSQAPENTLAADNGVAKQYINAAGSVFGPALAALIITLVVPYVGQIIGLILACVAKSKISKLPYVDVLTLDAATLDEYQSAAKKAKTAGILAKIALILSVALIALYIVSVFVGIIAGIILATM